MPIFDRVMNGPGTELRKVVEGSISQLRAMSDVQVSRPRVEGKWSPKEIIGHLIDSASNNHGRFVRAQLTADLRFQGYAQDDWVRVQHYRDANWSALIDLWLGINLHIARVMDSTPEDLRMTERAEHNLEEVGFRELTEGEAATLDWFMRDYVEHLKHHLRQIDPRLG